MRLLPLALLPLALLPLALSRPAPTAAQSMGPAAQYSDYHVKPGKDAAFLKGYRDHLRWHMTARDPWPWYVWIVITGERRDTYVGGTFDHDWADLERRPRPAQDSAHHQATIDPHLDGVRSRFLERRADLGGTLRSFESPFLAVLEVRVHPGERAAFERAVAAEARARRRDIAHAWFEVVSGDTHHTYLALVALQRRADMAAAAPHRLGLLPREGVASARSELLRLLPDTSTCKRAETRCLGVVPRGS